MKNEAQILAAKLLAQLLTEENQPQPENNREILSKLDELNSRLDKIENRINDQNPPTRQTDFSYTSFPISIHPSRERFALEEDLNEQEKACRFEPGGKPCDHCALCSSRGF